MKAIEESYSTKIIAAISLPLTKATC